MTCEIVRTGDGTAIISSRSRGGCQGLGKPASVAIESVTGWACSDCGQDVDTYETEAGAIIARRHA